MPPPQIAIEVAAAAEAGAGARAARSNRVQVLSKLRAALMEACTQASAGAECVPADGTRRAVAVALISRDKPGHFRIEVGAKEAAGQKWAARELGFTQKDEELEQWRAVGFAAGTLAAEVIKQNRSEDRAKASATPVPAPPAAGGAATAGNATQPEPPGNAGPDGSAAPESDDGPTALTPRTATAAPRKSRRKEGVTSSIESDARHDHRGRDERARATTVPLARFWFDAGAVAGPEMGTGGPRVGGSLRATRVLAGPLLTVSVSFTGKTAGRPSAQRLAFGGGGGYALQLGEQAEGELRAELLSERLEVSAKSDDLTDSDSRWVGAVRAGAAFAWMPLRALGLFASGGATARAAKTYVVVGDGAAEVAPAVDFEGVGGVRIAIP